MNCPTVGQSGRPPKALVGPSEPDACALRRGSAPPKRGPRATRDDHMREGRRNPGSAEGGPSVTGPLRRNDLDEIVGIGKPFLLDDRSGRRSAAETLPIRCYDSIELLLDKLRAEGAEIEVQQPLPKRRHSGNDNPLSRTVSWPRMYPVGLALSVAERASPP